MGVNTLVYILQALAYVFYSYQGEAYIANTLGYLVFIGNNSNLVSLLYTPCIAIIPFSGVFSITTTYLLGRSMGYKWGFSETVVKVVPLAYAAYINPLNYVAYISAIYLLHNNLIRKEKNISFHSYYTSSNFNDVEPSDTNLNDLGSFYKDTINSLSRTEFDKYKFYQVDPVEQKKSDVSKGTARMRELCAKLKINFTNQNVIEFGAGRGGWMQAIVERKEKFSSYTSYSRWHQPGQEKLWFNANEAGITTYSSDARHIIPRHCDILLSDMGENNEKYEDEVNGTLNIMRILGNFIHHKPSAVIIRLPTTANASIITAVNGWIKILGKGGLYRISSERNTVSTLYFTNLIENNPLTYTTSLIDNLLERVEGGIKYGMTPKRVAHNMVTGIKAFWQPIQRKLPVPELREANISEELNLIGPLRKPIGTTNFLKELGWKPSKFVGTSGNNNNCVMNSLTSSLGVLSCNLGLWKTTSTMAKDTYATVLKKIDKAPKEDHPHFNRLWMAYLGVSDYLLERKPKGLRMLTDDEIRTSTNPKGAMGWQEKHLPYNTIGEYVQDTKVWKQNVADFTHRLINNKGTYISYNSIGKKERKTSTSSRLIWFLPATARLFEARILGHVDTLLKILPYSVSGMPLYDYGECLSRIMTQDKRAVCDDIAGWDTKISHGILSMECAFLKLLTRDEEHRKLIQKMYEVYAYPTVMITRDLNGQVQDVLYRLRGQVASGRRVTYAMNTITNIVVTMSRAAFSQGVSEEDMRRWVLINLRKGHTKKYGGKISGDDSAVIMGPEEAELYATKGVQFTESIGMPRKNMQPGEDSYVYWNLRDIEFCSHQYEQVDMKLHLNGKQQIYKRWMPIRSADEIIAKARIMVGNFNTYEKQMAWARTQGLNLIVNYFHMPTIRQIGLAALSATPNNITLDGNAEGWSYRLKPWISNDDVISIINRCLLGDSTTFPVEGSIRSLDDLGFINYKARVDYELKTNHNIYRNWIRNLPKLVSKNRQTGNFYDNWINMENEEICKV